MPGREKRRRCTQLKDIERGHVIGLKTGGWSYRRIADNVDRSEHILLEMRLGAVGERRHPHTEGQLKLDDVDYNKEMTDSAPSDEPVTHGILDMGINLDEIHNVALLKLQKLNTLKDKHEHLEEEAENLTTILQDFMMVQMNIEAEENKLSCQIHEMEEELARKRDNLEVKVKEAARLQEQLITLSNKEEEDLQNYEAKMKTIFMKYQQAHENYVRQNQEDTMTTVENEKEAVQCEITKLKEQLVLVQAKFHDTFSKPQPQHADLVALCTVLKQMEADAKKCTGENAELSNRLKELEEEYKKLTLRLHTLKATL